MPQILEKTRFSVVDLSSFNSLCHGEVEAGKDYADAILKHSKDLGAKLFEADPALLSEEVAIIAIPRGGVPTAKGIHEAFNRAALSGGSRLVHSQIKTTPAELYQPEVFEGVSSILIVDGVIGTGKTICQHMEQIPSDWRGHVTIFSNAASEFGLKNIMQFADEKMSQPVFGMTGRVFPHEECEWVDCDGKQVYFIGYNESRGIDYKLPDFGDHISFLAP